MTPKGMEALRGLSNHPNHRLCGPQKQKILLFLKLDPDATAGPPGLSRNVSQIGHFGTGDLEMSVRSAEDLELAKPFMRLAYERIGG